MYLKKNIHFYIYIMRYLRFLPILPHGATSWSILFDIFFADRPTTSMAEYPYDKVVFINHNDSESASFQHHLNILST